MTTMGFHPHIIMLAKGLVEGAQSKVQINGHFTKPIDLKRGVRQGCPLSSLCDFYATANEYADGKS